MKQNTKKITNGRATIHLRTATVNIACISAADEKVKLSALPINAYAKKKSA